MAALYDLKDEYVLALKKMEEEGFDEQTIKDTLDGMAGELQDKIKNIAFVIQDAKGVIEVIKAEQDRLSKRKKGAENRLKGLSEYLLSSMQESGVVVDDPVLPVRLAKCPPSLGLIDEAKVPDSFYIQPPTPDPRLDRAELLRAVKINPIDGVELITDKKRLKIG